MAGRPRQFDENDVLTKAGNLFWMKGYEGVSTEELLMVMGIGKGSFYLQFKNGKRELYEKSMAHLAGESLRNLKQELSQSDNKLDVIKNRFFNRLADSSYRDKGCYIGNALVEMSNLDADLQQKASMHLRGLEETFCDVITEAQSQGRLKADLSAHFLSKYLINLWNGMNITRRMGGDEELLKQVVEKNLEILK